MKCLNQINRGNWCGESYEAASGYAAKRARALRRLGYTARCRRALLQETRLGQIRVTMIDIEPGHHVDTSLVSDVEMIPG